MKIQYYIKNVYGNDLMYIKDEAIAKSVRRLTGALTLTQNAKDALETLGHEFEQVLP